MSKIPTCPPPTTNRLPPTIACPPPTADRLPFPPILQSEISTLYSVIPNRPPPTADRLPFSYNANMSPTSTTSPTVSNPLAHSSSAANSAALEALATPVQFLKGVGPDRAKLLEKLELRTAADVLFNFPRDYQDLTDVRSIDALEEDKLQSVRGTVEEIDIRNRGIGRSILGVLVRQQSQYLRALWFNLPFMADKFRQGQEVLLSGKPRLKGGRWEMAHPRVQWIDTDEGEEPGTQLLPVYSLTEGVKQSGLRYITRVALDAYADLLEEAFPPTYLSAHSLLPIQTALREIHFPTSKETLQQARHRFIYQEMLILQLAMALKRHVQETARQRRRWKPLRKSTPALRGCFRLN